MTDHLNDWWVENEPICNTYPYEGSGFASCYQQRHGVLESHCNEISLDCAIPLNFSAYEPHVYYVLQSMYNLWFWYSSVYFAVVDATLLTDLNASQIVQTINPVHPGDTSLGVLLSALSAGFAFLSLPAGFGTIGSKIAATGIGQAPGLVKGLLPTGSLDSEFTQLAEIDQALGIVMDVFQQNLAKALNLTLTDHMNFLGLASNGSFISENSGALNASTAELKKILSTFIVSQALQANNIILTKGDSYWPYNISNNLSNTQGNDFLGQTQSDTPPANNLTYPILPQNARHVDCQDEPDEYGICDNWWGNFALYKLDDMHKNFHDLMETMFSNGWTTGEDLFEGSFNCIAFVGPGASGIGAGNDLIPSFSVSSEDLSSSCAANLRTCYWNPSNDPRLKDGNELIGLDSFRLGRSTTDQALWTFASCAYAWPDVCDNMSVEVNQRETNLTENGVVYVYPLENFTTFPSTNITNVKNCHKDVNTRGWGGAGYHQDSQTECDEYPASYLGPGLWLDTEFCES